MTLPMSKLPIDQKIQPEVPADDPNPLETYFDQGSTPKVDDEAGKTTDEVLANTGEPVADAELPAEQVRGAPRVYVLDLKSGSGDLARTAEMVDIQQFMALQLAGFATARMIGTSVLYTFHKRITEGQVNYMRQQFRKSDDDLSRPWVELKQFYEKRRVEFLRDLKEVPIALKKVRLVELQKLYDEARKAVPEHITRVPVMDPKTKLQLVDKNGRKIFRSVAKPGKMDVTAAAAILKQASQEVGDWKEQVEVTTSWVDEVKRRRKERGLS